MDAVSEVKARLSIEDVISEYVRLKKSGRNYKGLSPFTNEKTPSFVVSPEKQIWHDFSSGRGGDMFTFVQEAEGLDFKSALELLARKAGVDLAQFQTGKSGRPGIDKKRLQDALKLAVKFYQSSLLKEQKALEYLRRKRNFSKQTILDFQLGYSPNSPRALADFLLKKGFNEKELELAGLVNRRRNQAVDMFRGRIMIPLHDSIGVPVGFTARLLKEDKNSPKYINTPATPLYDKSRHIYGLHLAKQAIREVDYSIVTEGNLDVIASHQAGFKQVVASAGTAMTEYQLKTLSRFSPTVRLAFDRDRAGLEATERSIPIASKAGVDLSIISIPEGKDPDELIRKDPKLWGKAIEQAEYAVDWLINTYKNEFDLNSAQGKKRFTDKLVSVIGELEDPVEQNHYIKLVSEIASIDTDALKQKLTKAEPAPSRLKKPSANLSVAKEDQDLVRITDRLLCLVISSRAARKYLELLIPEMLPDPRQRMMLNFLLKNPDFDMSDEKHLENLTVKSPQISEANLEDYVKILMLQFEQLYAQVDELELQYEAARLRAKIIEYFVKRQKTKLSALLTASKDTEQEKILMKARELDKLLKKINEV